MGLLDTRDSDGTFQQEGRQSVKRCVNSAICIPQTTGVELCAMGKTEKYASSSAEQSPHAVSRREMVETALVSGISMPRGAFGHGRLWPVPFLGGPSPFGSPLSLRAPLPS